MNLHVAPVFNDIFLAERIQILKTENNYKRPDSLQRRIDAIGAIEGETASPGLSVAIVIGRWHQQVVDGLLQGALEALQENGIGDESVDIVYVPGAFEIPLAVKKLADNGRYRALVTLGAVIRGGTPHFEYVAGECVRGMADVSLEYDLPVAFGVLTVDTEQQAFDRAAAGPDNKGREAVLAVLEMAGLMTKLSC